MFQTGLGSGEPSSGRRMQVKNHPQAHVLLKQRFDFLSSIGIALESFVEFLKVKTYDIAGAHPVAWPASVDQYMEPRESYEVCSVRGSVGRTI